MLLSILTWVCVNLPVVFCALFGIITSLIGHFRHQIILAIFYVTKIIWWNCNDTFDWHRVVRYIRSLWVLEYNQWSKWIFSLAMKTSNAYGIRIGWKSNMLNTFVEITKSPSRSKPSLESFGSIIDLQPSSFIHVGRGRTAS